MILKRLLTVTLFLLSILYGHAQKETAIWYFGRNAGLDFNSGVPVPLTDGELDTEEGCSAISDFNGNLLFYSDGITVWNRNHQPMPNGTGLRGDFSSTQSAIIVPRPGSSTIFYVFTVDDVGGPDGLMYSEVDMGLDATLGDVTAVKNVQLATPVAEKLTAVKHANGIDVWVLAHGRYDNTFMAYLVTAAGVLAAPVYSNIGFDLSSFSQVDFSLGYLKASPDGTKVATCFFSNAVELYDFDDATGMLSNVRTASDDASRYFYGIEFSQDGRMLYVSNYRDEIYQYDTNAANLENSEVLLFQKPDARFGGLQLALDGKIYLANRNRTYLSVIEQPDTPGLGCNFVEVGVDLNGRFSELGLPPFIQSFFQVAFTTENLCSGSPTDFELTTTETILSVLWDFGDGNTSTVENPSHTYTIGGTYTVSATVTTAIGTRTETGEITIYQTPMANIALDIQECSLTANVEFDLSTKDPEVLGPQSVAEFEVAYYPTLVDAENTTNPLPSLYTNTAPTETVYARIQNSSNADCYAITDFDLVVKAAPTLHLATDWTVCDTDADGLYTFDLLQKDGEIYNGQDPSVFTVAYFGSQADADANLNAIGPGYTNTNPVETIYYRIHNTAYPECYETGNFMIEVIAGVTANTPADLEVCDNDNDGFHVFDLSATEAEIIGGQNAGSISISYHRSQSDAENNVNALPLDYTNGNAYSETVYVRAENTADGSCYDTTTFAVRVFDSPVLRTVEDWQVCDDDNDGSYSFDLALKDAEILGGQSATDFSITYYLSDADAQTGQNALTGSFDNTANPQSIYYRIENNATNACFVTDSFALQVFVTPTAYTPVAITACDSNETGIQIFDLSTKDIEVLGGQDASIYEVAYFANVDDAANNRNALPKTNYQNTALQQTIYARIHATAFPQCHDITSFSLRINPLPEPDLEETYVICPDSPDLTIDGGDFESWTWHEATGNLLGDERFIELAELGDYSVTVSRTSNGIRCEKTVFFEVVSSGAPEDFTAEVNGFSDEIEVTITVNGIGDFEYSADGENFQDSPILNVLPGLHTLFVRDKFLCRTISREIVALGYQKFFTPNNDGINDYWKVIGAEFFPESEIYIFDRYGKLLQQLSSESNGWDGRHKGLPMPATDYWFRFENGDGSVFTGHFSLKR